MKTKFVTMAVKEPIRDYIKESVESIHPSVTISDFLLSATKRFMRDYQVEGLTVFEDQAEANEQVA